MLVDRCTLVKIILFKSEIIKITADTIWAFHQHAAFRASADILLQILWLTICYTPGQTKTWIHHALQMFVFDLLKQLLLVKHFLFRLEFLNCYLWRLYIACLARVEISRKNNKFDFSLPFLEL